MHRVLLMVPSLTSAKSKFLSLSISVLSLTIIWPFQAVAYDEAQLTRFKAIKKCRSCDLSSANLSVWYQKHKENLARADLEGANLSKVYLYEANLNGADLTGANLNGADLTGANLRLANLYKADLYEANLTGASLRGANLGYANLKGANLTGADLRTELDLYKADLSNADLTGANIEGADFRDAIFCNTKTPWGLENIGCE